MVKVTINLADQLLEQVDQTAQDKEVSRSRFIADCIASYFAPNEPKDAEVNLLTNDITHLNEVISMREAEISELKELNGHLWSEWHDCNDKLTHFMLPPPRRSFWNWVRRKQ
jgi:metal-responsive CopG/Arc/MetJ family transcriptional regulator